MDLDEQPALLAPDATTMVVDSTEPVALPIPVLTTAHATFENNVIALPERRRMRVLLWNIQDLGGGPSRPKTTRADEVKRGIAELIWTCRADFVGLLELKRSGARPAKPVKPTAAKATQSNPFVERFGSSQEQIVDLAAMLSDFVYMLVNEIVWDEAVELAAGADTTEVAPGELKAVAAPDPAEDVAEDPVATCVAVLRTSYAAHPKIEDIIRALEAADLAGKVAKLRDDARALAKRSVLDWSALPIEDRRKWPKHPETEVKKVRNRCKGAPMVSIRARVEQEYGASASLPRGAKHVKGNDDLERHLSLEGMEVARLVAWTTTVLAIPQPKPASDADDQGNADAEVWNAAQELRKTLDLVTTEMSTFTEQWKFLQRVVREVMIPVGDAAAGALRRSARWSSNDAMRLATALLRGAIRIRDARFVVAEQRYNQQIEDLKNSGAYPGLLEFLDIAERVQALSKGDLNIEYAVWPPLDEMRALAKECAAEAKKDMPSATRGAAAQRCSQYFTADEGYGILYNKRMFFGPGDDLGGGRIYPFRPYFLSSFSKRAPLVVPLRVRNLDVDIRFIPWHTPAPSSGNAGIRAKDFPTFKAAVESFRARGQLAIFLSDTNIDAQDAMLASRVEHWEGNAPTRKQYLLDITGEPKLFEQKDLILTQPTSLRKSKLADIGAGKRFAYHCAAYDKVLLVSSRGWRGARLEYGKQTIVSAARAMLPHRPPVAPDDPPQPSTPIQAPGSPMFSISRTFSSGLSASLLEPLPAQPREAALQIVTAARVLSDHDGVAADFVLVASTEPAPDLTPLVEAFKVAVSGGEQVDAALVQILESVVLGGATEGVDETRLGEELVAVLASLKLAETAEPKSIAALSVGKLQSILRAAVGAPAPGDAKVAVPDGEPDGEPAAIPDVGPTPPPPAARPSAREVFEGRGLQTIRNAGGGACLFYSVCDLRYGPNTSFATAYGVRVRAVAHLRAIMLGQITTPPGMTAALTEMLKWHVEGFPGEAAYADGQWATYLREMLKPYTWGDLIMLSVMSHMFGQAYHVHVQSGAASWEDEVRFGASAESAHVLYCQNQFHWEALAAAGGPAPAPLPAELLGPVDSALLLSTSVPLATFPFDTSKRVVLWDTTSNACWWSPDLISRWGVTSWMFVFGDNCMRTNTGGQANIRGKSYARGLRTCKEPPGRDNVATFHFVDAEIDQNKLWIEEDLQKIWNDAPGFDKIAIPFHAGYRFFDLGTERAQMLTYAPNTFAWLQARLAQFVVDLENHLAALHGGAPPPAGPPPGGPPPGGPPPGGPPDDDDDDAPGGGSGEPPWAGKRKAASSQGPLKRAASEQNNLQIQVRSMVGSSSGAPGFAHADVTAVPHFTDVLPLTICEFPPDVGDIELDETAVNALVAQFREEHGAIERALTNPDLQHIEIQPIWGGLLDAEDAHGDVRDDLEEIIQATKRRRVMTEEDEGVAPVGGNVEPPAIGADPFAAPFGLDGDDWLGLGEEYFF